MKITLTATVPIASNVVVNLNQNNEQIVISTCGVVFGPGAAGQTKTFEVVAKKDFVNDGNQRTTINTFVTSTTGHIDWSGYSQTGIQVCYHQLTHFALTQWYDMMSLRSDLYKSTCFLACDLLGNSMLFYRSPVSISCVSRSFICIWRNLKS